MTAKKTATKVPGIGQPPASVDPATRKYLASIVEAIEIRLGRRGDPRDRAITLRELINSGLAEELKASKFDPNSINSGNIGMGVVGGDSGAPFELETPDTPVGFTATGGYQKVLLSWEVANYYGHSQTEVWRYDTDSIGDAILVGIAAGPTYVDNVGGGQTFYYWIRHTSTTGEHGNFNATQGTVATTSPDVSILLDELAGAITESELSAALATRITDTETGIADLTTIFGTTVNAAASAAAAAQSAADAAADALLTAADVQSTAQDAVDTAADLAATAQDVIDSAANAGTATTQAAAALQSAQDAASDAGQAATDAAATAADVITTTADAAQTALDRAQTAQDVLDTAADVISTGTDVAATAADLLATGQDVLLTAADAAQTALDRGATNADVLLTNADVLLTNADASSTAADVIAAASSATAAAASSSASSSSSLVAKARSIDAERALKASGSISERICLRGASYNFAVEEDGTEIYKNGTLLTTIDRGSISTQTLAKGDKIAASKPFNACTSDNQTLASLAHAGRWFGLKLDRGSPVTLRIYPLTDGEAYIRKETTYDYGAMSGVTPVTLTAGTIYEDTNLDFPDTASTTGYITIKATCDVLVYKQDSSNATYDHMVVNPASERIVGHMEVFERIGDNVTANSGGYTQTGKLTETTDLEELVWGSAIGDGAGQQTETHVPYEFLGDEYIIPDADLHDFAVASFEDNLEVRVRDKDNNLLYTKTVGTAGNLGMEGQYTGAFTSSNLSTGAGPYYFSGNQPFYLRTNLDEDEAPVIGYRRDVKALAGNQAAVAATYYASEASASETAAGQEASAANLSAVAANTSAGDALASEQAAAQSESNASGSASTATTQAGLATTARGGAETAETNALASEQAAAQSESNASGFASTATTQAGLATTARGGAETAETNALASEQAAATSESNASGFASTATTQAGLATTAKTDAETAETNALASEQAAAASVITAAGHSSVASTQATLATDAASDSEDARDVVLIETAAAGEIRFVTKDAWIKNPQSYDLGTDDPRLIRNSSTYTSTSAEFITNDAEFGVAYMGALADNHAVGPRKVYPFASDKVYFVRVVARVVDDGTDNGGGRVLLGYNGFDASGTRQQTNPDYNNVQPFSVYKLVSDGVFEIAGFIGGPDYTDAQLEALNTVIDNAPSGQSGDRAYVTTTGTDPVPTSIAFQLRQNSSSTIGQVALKSFEVIDVTELIKAEIQADAASGFAGSASVSAGAAAGSASTASGHASTASTQAGLATTARSGAETAETNAQASETAASNSEIASAGSAATAAGHASTASTKADLATSVGARANLIDQGASNAGFEQGVAGVGAPAGWTVEAQNSITNLGFVTDVGTTSEFGSELSYGIISPTVYSTGHWVTHYKHFLVEPGKTLKTKCRVWNYDYENITPTTTDPQDSYWVGEDDTICVWSFYDSEGVFLSSLYSQSAGHLYAVANNITTSGALGAAVNETWIDFEPAAVTVPANSVYAKIEIVGVDYNGQVIPVSNRGDYTTWTGGNWMGRIDDVQFLCTDGSIQEISQGPMEAAISATAASVSQGAAAGSASTALGHASTASTQAGLATTARGGAETAETNALASEQAAAQSESNASGFASTASTQAGLATTAKTDAETAETNALASEQAAAASVVTAAGHASTASQSSTLAASAQTAAESARDGIVYQNFAFDGTFPTTTKPIWVSQSADASISSTQAKFGSNSLKVTSGQTGSTDIFYSDQLDFFPESVIGDKYTWGMWVYIDGSGTSTESYGLAGDGGWATASTSTRNQWVFLTATGTMGNQAANTLDVKLEFRSNPLESNDVATYIDGVIIVKGEVDLTSVEVDDSAVRAAHNSADFADAALVSQQSATASQSAANSSAGVASSQAGIATTKAGEAAVSASNAASSESNASGSASNASTEAGLAASARADAESARDAMVLENLIVDSRLSESSLIGGWDSTNLYQRSSGQSKFGTHSLGSTSGVFTNQYPIFYYTDIPIISGEKFTWGAWVYKNWNTDITIQFQQFGGWAAGTVTATNAWQFVTGQGTALSTMAVNLEMDIRGHMGGSGTRQVFIDGLILVRGHHDLTVVEASDAASTASEKADASADAALLSQQSATASQTAAGNSASAALASEGLAAQSASDASASEAAALVSETNAATSESNAAGSESSASSSSTLAASAQSAAEDALAETLVELAASGPSRVTPIVESWAFNPFDKNLDSSDDRFINTGQILETDFTTTDSVFGDAYNFGGNRGNDTFGPRKSYPYGPDKVYMLRAIYRVALESTVSTYASSATNVYLGATTRGGDGLTLRENLQPGQQQPNQADGETEFVMVFHGDDYTSAVINGLDIVNDNKTTQVNNTFSGLLTVNSTSSANGSDTPAKSIGFHIRQNASNHSDGSIAVKSFEVFDITEAVLAEIKADAAAVSAAAALVSEGNASASEGAAGGFATTATNQAGIATTKAGQASTSAANAAQSETNAASSESAASSSESNAASSASDAASSEANALTYQNAAAGSATSAAGSSSSAATSEGVAVAIQERMNLVDGGVVNAGFEADQASTSVDTWPTGWDCDGQRADAPNDVGVVSTVVNSSGDFSSTQSFGTHVTDSGSTGDWMRLSKYFIAEPSQKFNVDMAVNLAGTVPAPYNRDPEWVDEDDVFIIYNWYDEDGALLSQTAVPSATSEYNQANGSWVSGSSRAPQQTWFDYVSDEGTAPANTAFVRIDLILIDDQPGNIGTDVLVNYVTWAAGGNFRGYIDDVQFLSSNGSIVETNKGTVESAISAAASQTSAANASASEGAAGGFATTASNQAGVATTKAGEASTSAGNAATSESNAQGSANTAAAQATLATTAKNDAETAETNAQASESAAAQSETNAAGSASSASSQATLAATARSDTDDLKDAVLVETAANGEIQFINPTSWQQTQQSHNLYSTDNRFAGAGNATASFFVTNDAEFGNAYVPTLGLNDSISPRRVQPYSSDKVYLVRVISRVLNDGPTIGTGVRLSLGINGWKADGTRITSSPDLNNYQPVNVTKTVADGVYELSVFFGGSDYTDAELEAFDLVTENAPDLQSGGRAWAIIPPNSGTNNEPDLAFVNFQIRHNAGGLTDGQPSIQSMEVIDVTEAIKAEIKADAAAVSAAAALVSEGNASASESDAGNFASTATTQAGIASTKAGDASGFASDASGFASQAQQSASNAAGSSSTASTQAGLAATAASDAEDARDAIVYQNYAFDGTFPGGVKPQWTDQSSNCATSTTYFKLGTHSLKIPASGTSSVDIFETALLDSFPDIATGDKLTWGMWVYIDGSGTTSESFGFAGDGGWGTASTAVRNSWVFLTQTGTAGSWPPLYGLRLELRSAPIGTTTDNAVYVDGVIVVRGEVDLTTVEVDDSAVRSAHKSSDSASAANTSAGQASASANTAGQEATTATTQAGIATTKAGDASTFASNAANSASNAAGSSTTATTQAGLAATARTNAEAARDSMVLDNVVVDSRLEEANLRGGWNTTFLERSTTQKKFGTHSAKTLSSSNFYSDSSPIIYQTDIEQITGEKFTWGVWVYKNFSGNISLQFPYDGGWAVGFVTSTNAWQFVTGQGTASSTPGANISIDVRSHTGGSGKEIFFDGLVFVRGHHDLTVVETSDRGSTAQELADISASAASTSAGQASASANTAGQEATTATSQAGIATTKAGEASTFASNAANSASNAAGSENTATTQAGLSSASAGNAAGSATASANSASGAATSASNAASSAAAAALDVRLLEARVTSGLNGHYVSNDWYLRSIDGAGAPAYVVALEDGVNIYIEKMTDGTQYTVKENADAYTNYNIPSETSQSGDGPWRVFASGPIICKHADGVMGAPANFSSTLLANSGSRYNPYDIYLFAPYGEAQVDVYYDANGAADFIESSSTVDDTIIIPAGGYYHYEADVDLSANDAAATFIFKSDARITGIFRPTGGGDNMLMIPMTNGEAVSNYEAAGEIVFYANSKTSGTPTRITNGNARYYATDDEDMHIAYYGHADGAGGDAEFGLPREAMSDLYVWPEPNLSNYRIVAVEPCEVTVMKADGTVLYREDLSAASTSAPLFVSQGSNTGNTNINTGGGPYRFVGTAPFHLIAQEGGDDDETVLLGARQAKLGDNSVQAIAKQVNTVQSAVDGQTATVSANAQSVNGLEAQYTVKIDNNGAVAGYGLASTTTGSGNIVSEFIVNADRFAILKDASDTGTAQVPFSVVTSSYTNNGVTVTPGVYITDAFIANGTIDTAKIGNAAIDDAKIANLSAGKISTGTLNAANVNIEGVTSGIDLKSAATGARMEIKADSIKVFDSSGTVRIKLGNL
jgi:hypothetical protein